MAKFCLLTGATGFLGRYLLKDLAAAGVPLAVIARRGKLQSARDRIEVIMAAWEARRGHCLPRPVVFEGDLHSDNLGLDESAMRWVGAHCDTVLHSAASMSFVPDEATGEPRRTNVEGAARLLEFCRTTRIRRFHHVSTAYICGLRTGRVLESELDLGQALGNVYEESKLAAEKLLRDAQCLDVLTVYRPASIVGDSETGAANNFHGFYLPLQLAYAFSAAVPPEVMDQRFSALLGLTGQEGKNLVPVDWISAAIAHLFTHSEHHGKVYHLTHPHPTTVRAIQQVIQEAIRTYSTRPTADRVNSEELATYEKLFYGQMSIYRSHWRDDPIFDRTNTDAAVPHLPCPEMDHAMLMHVARYPIATNFEQRRYEPVSIEFDVAGRLGQLITSENDGSPGRADGSVDMHVTGPGGGQWRLLMREGMLIAAQVTSTDGADAMCHLSSETFAAVARGRLSVGESLGRGQIVIEGPTASRERIVRAVEQATASAGQPVAGPKTNT
jgi:thioester reductase-like protein